MILNVFTKQKDVLDAICALHGFETKNKMRPHNMVQQVHARKATCYFWVFQKCERRNFRR